MSKICGAKSWKDRLLQKCFKDATGGEKKCIQSWSGAHIDWRWENLEHVLSQAIFAIPLLVKYFDARHFTEEGAMISRLSIFLADHQLSQLLVAQRCATSSLPPSGGRLLGSRVATATKRFSLVQALQGSVAPTCWKAPTIAMSRVVFQVHVFGDRGQNPEVVCRASLS